MKLYPHPSDGQPVLGAVVFPYRGYDISLSNLFGAGEIRLFKPLCHPLVDGTYPAVQAYIGALQPGERVVEIGQSCMTGTEGTTYPTKDGLCVMWDGPEQMGTSVTWGTRRVSEVTTEDASARLGFENHLPTARGLREAMAAIDKVLDA